MQRGGRERERSKGSTKKSSRKNGEEVPKKGKGNQKKREMVPQNGVLFPKNRSGFSLKGKSESVPHRASGSLPPPEGSPEKS